MFYFFWKLKNQGEVNDMIFQVWMAKNFGFRYMYLNNKILDGIHKTSKRTGSPIRFDGDSIESYELFLLTFSWKWKLLLNSLERTQIS